MSPAAPARGHRHHALVLRDAAAGPLTDLFLVAAVATILAVRALLALTGYPQLGGRHLHVAHMLWGGLGLTAAVVLLLISLRPRAKWVAALIGGVGFGLFIDELGKFLTRDNDYFYQPAVAIIYLLFVVFYLLVRRRLAQSALDTDEHLANALAIAREMALEDLDANEKARALRHLARCAPGDPRVPLVRGFVDSLATVPPPPPAWPRRASLAVAARGARVLEHPRFPAMLSFLFLGQALVVIVYAALTARTLWTGWHTPPEAVHVDLGVMELLRFASSLVSGALVWAGVVQLLRSRERAFRAFRLSLHVSVFITQVFVFYDAQLAGVFGLGFNLALLAAVQWLLEREHRAPSTATVAAAQTVH